MRAITGGVLFTLLAAAPVLAARAILPGPLSLASSDPDGNYPVSWGPSPTPGVRYLLQEATNQTFTEGRRVVYFGPALSKTLTGRVPAVTYFYRVRAVIPGLQGSGWRKGMTGCLIEPPPPSSVGTPLNDTGMTWYGADAENFLATAPPGFEGQDADHGRDHLAKEGVLVKVGGGNGGFDFTKLDGNGIDLPASATSWSCVRDNHTGLVWEVKTIYGLRGLGWQFSWYNSDPASNGGSAGYLDPNHWASTYCGEGWGDFAHCNTEAYVGAVNEAGLCGANDWRLPTRHELHSIVDYGGKDVRIDSAYFPGVQYSWYGFWTSSAVADDSTLAWYVNFANGTAWRDRRERGHQVLLVHGGQ
jgi:hypothetical protein